MDLLEYAIARKLCGGGSGGGGGAAPVLQEKAVTVTENGNQTITPDAGYDGMSRVGVTVDVPTPEPEISLQDKNVTANGTYTADSGFDGLGTVTVDVPSAGGGGDPELKSLIERSSSVVTVPNGTTSIGDYAFYNHSNLSKIVLPDSLVTIGANAFYYCEKLSFTALPNGVKRINDFAFQSCSELALTKLPDTVEYLGTSAFSNCKKLAITRLPASLIYINGGAFYNCTGLVALIIERMRDILSSAFYNCSNLEEITILSHVAGVSHINNNVFTGCAKLHTINVPWSEGEVSGAPWGATKATINYNYTGG